MDYSSLPHEPESPAGTSPWQTSPDASRHFDKTSSDSGPPSPTPQQSSTVASQNLGDIEPPPIEPQLREDINYGHTGPNLAEEDDFLPRPARKTPRTMPDVVRYQEAPLTEEEIRQKSMQQQRQQERYQQALHAQHTARGPTRYHPGGPQGVKRPPQYRMQAKITGLERTGKKDPSIRFDVHVRLSRQDKA